MKCRLTLYCSTSGRDGKQCSSVPKQVICPELSLSYVTQGRHKGLEVAATAVFRYRKGLPTEWVEGFLESKLEKLIVVKRRATLAQIVERSLAK